MTKENVIQVSPYKYVKDVTIPLKTTISRADALKAFYDLRDQVADLPEITLEEINAEIESARAERKR